MANFVQVMKDWRRMCDEMNSDDKYNVCDNCRLKDYGCPAIYESENASTDWGHIEKVVTAWAAEHPEPVYETWGQYFKRYYGLEYCKGHEMLLENIPADIAQKLGIEPKEG